MVLYLFVIVDSMRHLVAEKVNVIKKLSVATIRALFR